MKNVLLRARNLSVSTISICVVVGASSSLFGQARDFNAERFLLDDNAGDGTRNTLLLQVPVTGLTANRTLIFPDADGTVVITGPGGLTANQILFGGPSGQIAQSASLLWDNTTSIFSIGGGLFTVDGSSGEISNSTGDLQLADNVDVTGDLDVGAGNFTVAAATGNAGVGGTLTVNGATTLVGAVDAQAAGNVIGDGTDAEQLEVQGVDGGAVDVDINGDVDISGTLTVGSFAMSGDLDMNQNDVVDLGNIEFSTAGSNLSNTAGDVTVNDNLVVTGTSDLQGAVGNTTGDLQLADNVDVTGDLDVGAGNFTVAAATGNADIGGTLNVDGATTHVGTLDQQGAVSNSTGDVTINDNLVVTGTSDLQGAVGNTTGDLQLADNVDVTGDLDVGAGNFTVAAATGNAGVGGTLTVNGATTLVGAVDAQAAGNVIGDGTDAEQLEVQGVDGGAVDVDINGDVDISGTLTVGSFAMSGDLDMNDNDIINVGELRGNSTDGGLNVNTTNAGDVNIGNGSGAINTNGTITSTGDIIPSVDNTYDLGSATNRWGEVFVSGGTVHIGSSTDEAEVSFDAASGLEFDGNDDGTADLTIDGTTGDVDIAGNLDVAGTLTLPSTPAQGDALIASINTATTTINTARIGAGLTDAQVDDNLTISGGTVDGTPIGATTPSTGAFTTITGTALPSGSTSGDLVVSNGGSLETRTIASLNGTIGVSTDATLTGDGTTGLPLGFDLTNANTWTGTQTLPTTAAQGDVLIASTNAGTTTIDAARIGTGLTDAQVDDNLTVNGGTVDATPVGATTPSTGAFTTLTGTTITGTALPSGSTSGDLVVSNGGSLETRTIASLNGTIGVSTDATLTGDGTTSTPLGLNVANANTWTGTQTLPATAAQGDALIASTNAGTTTIDAARIGSGLTDAQVDDNLTLNGGTVDATPIGATTPSTGAFTTITGTTLPAASTSGDLVVSNGGSLETRTIASLNGTIGVSTDATLTGDGTTGSPLGFDLTNANTWTGTQTLPTTAAQGDALIASTNAGTTTIDAARIGTGLTDAQVNDNLTVNGGTVDATPVGATTPSTGAFTTITGTSLPAASTSGDIVVSNGGSLETRTIASLNGTIGVSTDATLTGDGTTSTPLGLNVANANTWTGTQTLPATAAQGDALIASTNAGTTTVDAARIGAGLTDAQVNDNLTVNGGTVDATPVGATTPSTGAFTTLTGTTITGTALPATSTSGDIVVSNGGSLETRTIASLNGTIGVSTDATLTGDGTTGSPLGFDLTNANTWTGTQTLPTTAAQGDALIASTNAGTTTIDAARIGTGLTDAQVNDNLTVNGGTVDATPVGATTPSTGAFTTLTGTTITGTALPAASTSGDIVVSNGGSLETRTIASLNGTIGVSTDATLTGDGTTGSPLGFDLTNANTWTGTQTLPTTAAQGDALIASTNAGTTTVDAARIGAGLTDAQVNDNLTVNGGTVDATPVGATTPSTGAFTTITGTSLPATSTSGDLVVSNGGSLETRTIASLNGTIGVSTDATLTGDGTTSTPLGLNVANANTWTGTQTLPTTAAQGDALIASTNAGTTTIDAARIGAGLTDAQVNDNLTLNGGTVDATPVGATTPSTGAFTTLTATGISDLQGAVSNSAGNLALNDNIDVTGNIVPTADDLYNLGSSTNRWAEVFVNGSTIHIGSDADESEVRFNSGTGLEFDGDDDGTADLTIDGASGNVGIGGDLNVSGTLTAGSFTLSPTELDMNGNNIVGVGNLEFSGVGSTIGNTAGDVTIDDNLGVTGASTLGDGDDNVAINVGTGDLTLVGIDAGAATDELLTINTGTNVIGRRDFSTAVDQGVTYDGTNGEFVLGADVSGTNPITTGRFVTVDNQLTFDGSGIVEVQSPTLRLGQTGTTAIAIGNSSTDHTIAGNNVTGMFDGQVSLTSDADISLNHSLTGGGVTTQATTAVSSSGAVVNATYTSGATSDLSELLVDATTVSAVSYTDDGAGNLTNYFELTADHNAQSLLISLTDDVNTPANATSISADNPTNTVGLSTTDGTGSASAVLVGTNGSESVTLTAGTGSLAVEPTQTSVTGDLAVTGKATSASTDVADPGNTLVTKDYLLAGNLAVSTDATLTGDGTTGLPLGLNVANANTWTGTQTLPATAAQGDALIASTNAGTTTIDAARIGAGLTDAQVNDNLTLNGGTVDATPVGATTPSTGAFTTITGTSLPATSTSGDIVVSNGGSLETRTIASLNGTIGVSTDATLTGDGTTGSPLGFDLTNANTWTGTQTLPTTAAQGDALIASTNAGTTTIDAARIGTGLTDAQVNDNLTLNGGTVDATPVGATTPSTGAFTTITGTTLPAASTSGDIVVSNGGSLETRTIASLNGTIGVSTDATLTGDGTTGSPLGFDLTNANTWTGTQTLPATAAQGDALIASTNAGTTTVDAARIGAGLTDAQVNDNLTVNGGTVDATPVGATTPSTGAFTTLTGTTITGTALPAASTSGDIVVSNGGSLETRTIASLNGTIGVSTDATLTGDGTTGSPLGFDLTNANTWTGTQTLPTTAAQGDALIASTNAGTTTIDAARIGAGLTDAQVNDNLTLNGGTVDATPVGATTPSTGAFTTITGTSLPATSTSGDLVVSNGGSLETRTIASLNGTIGVSTDATLTGDGTTGSPLGFDLTNANTWTGTQTLPTTAAQGDALIASTNAGTTTIDAARIGAGLTDAQVNDNLTLNGGTVDATPVGATTPSTGAFTTITGTSLPATSTSGDLVVSNGGSLETRTIASLNGTIGVSTDATLTGDGTTSTPLGLNVANANTWTGTQTLPATAAQGDALIASTNAGTTTIDAARIGTGLTDAQVNDNLTVNGGTVDATPVGATTPSTGAFTTLTGTTITGTALPSGSTSGDLVVSNGGSLETRTIASLNGTIGVSTDATLTGDGTTGLPLGLNVANANTWTGTQTLPATAAQGDALIASTNAGTTTIDAARIGAGLTDAQVNDNLAISGGTVDATPVGATTPSTGAFTTLEASGTTTLNGNVNLGDASTDVTTFSGQTVQSYGTVAAGATITIPNNATVVTITDDAATPVANAITMPGGTNGQVLYIYNGDADATTTVVINSGATAQFVYAAGAWRRVGP